MNINHKHHGWAAAALAAWVVVCASAQSYDEVKTPEELRGVGVEEQLDTQLPLDLTFTDENGKRIKLGDYFGKRPVILTLNYYTCPMLCDLTLNGMVDTLKEITLNPADDFEIVTLSIEPLEKPPVARAKKKSYVAEYGRSGARSGWHFLTGKKDQIRALTDSVGFNYRWNDERKEWAHPSTLIICTPEGRVSRYLGGIMFDPRTVRLSLVEASNGKIGSLWDQVFLTCFHYISSDGKYTASAVGLMRVGGVATILLLGMTVLTLWLRESQRRKKTFAEAAL